MTQAAVEGHATVWVSEAGAPDRLVWHGRRWLVIDRPTLWIKRDRWWDRLTATPSTDSRSAPPTAAGFPVWRTQISPADDEHSPSLVVDIAHRDGIWTVAEVAQQ